MSLVGTLKGLNWYVHVPKTAGQLTKKYQQGLSLVLRLGHGQDLKDIPLKQEWTGS